jgi:hypothetical protein
MVLDRKELPKKGKFFPAAPALKRTPFKSEDDTDGICSPLGNIKICAKPSMENEAMMFRAEDGNPSVREHLPRSEP